MIWWRVEHSGHSAIMRSPGKHRMRSINDDEPIVMVEVINATPEPDGTPKHYWLRVPPEITTAQEAVAWTFDIPAEDSVPTVET